MKLNPRFIASTLFVVSLAVAGNMLLQRGKGIASTYQSQRMEALNEIYN